MKLFLLRYKKYILITLGILAVSFFLLNKKNPPIPQITNFTPPDNSQKIDLRAAPSYLFDTPVAIEDLIISSTPTFNFTLTSENQNTISATHSLAFQPATTYVITITLNDKVLQTHSFTTLATQEDPLLIQSMNEELARDYPLAQKLPNSTSFYRVVYSSPMTLEITLKNSNLTSAEVIDEVKSWVEKNGGDVSAHKFVITTPTP